MKKLRWPACSAILQDVWTLCRCFIYILQWHHQIKTFSSPLAFCAGNSLVTGEFPTQRLVTRSFDVFFELHLNQQLNKQWRRWWFKTPSRSLSRHCNVPALHHVIFSPWGLKRPTVVKKWTIYLFTCNIKEYIYTKFVVFLCVFQHVSYW